MMKIKEGYRLRKVLDIYLVMGVGAEAYTPNCIMSVNETGAFLWEKLSSGAERAALLSAMTEEYEVDEAAAAEDLGRFLTQLQEKALLEAC